MALCLRKLDRKIEWDDPREDELWLGVNDLRADALGDLTTENNSLSIWEVSEEIPAERILAALAAKRDNVAKLDFIRFDSAILDELGIVRERANGNTHDARVNSCHLNLIQLTASKLSTFGARMRASRKAERYQDKKVVGLIQDSVDKGFIDRNQLKPNLAARIRAS